MEDIIVDLVKGLAIKLVGVGLDVWRDRRARDPAHNAVAIASNGARYTGGLPMSGGMLVEPAVFSVGYEPVEVDIRFSPANTWAGTYLSPDQPVLIAIEDRGIRSSLDSIVIPAWLGDGIDIGLYPGQYFLAAYVFRDTNLNALDGISGGAFSVARYDRPFTVRVVIESVADEQEILQALGLTADTEQDGKQRQCEAAAQTGRQCRNNKATENPFLCGNHLARLHEGFTVVDYQTGDHYYLT